MDKISVIIPVYNVEKYLTRCIRSILNQEYKYLEIILVDDGSTDTSGLICDKFNEDNKNIIVIHKENGGLSSARNAGLDIASGDYVVFVDSDDWLPIYSISYLYELIKKDNSDFAMGQFNRCGDDVDNTYSKKNVEDRIFSKDEFLKLFFKINTQENVQYVCAKIFKMELFSNIRFPVGVIDEDVPTMFNIILESKKISYTSCEVYYYYLNPDSITLSAFSEKKFDLLKVWDMVCAISKTYNCEQWIDYFALLNRKRANFGVLCNMVCSSNFIDNEKKYRRRITNLIECLKQDLWMFIGSPIPISRKVLMLLFCMSYHFWGYWLNKFFLYRRG